MSAVQPSWTDDPRFHLHRLSPFGIEQCAPQRDGIYTFPAQKIMSNPDERETTITTPAPAPSSDAEPLTNPENEVPVRVSVVRPPPLKYDTSFLTQDDSVFSRAVVLVAGVGNDIDRDRNERREAAESAAAAQKQLLEQNAAILAAVQKADENSNKNYDLLREQIRQLKSSDLKQDERLKEGDLRFEQIEQSIARLKDELLALVDKATREAADKIDALEKQLEEARAHHAPTQTASPTG